MAADRFSACVDDRTRVIAVSHVSYLTGERHDLAALRVLADRVGALLVVDFTQAAGWMPIDASVADFGFSACYKWLADSFCRFLNHTFCFALACYKNYLFS